MAKFILPFIETNRGWYEIEADTLDEAKTLAEDNLHEFEPFYKDGETNWNENDIYEEKEQN